MTNRPLLNRGVAIFRGGVIVVVSFIRRCSAAAALAASVTLLAGCMDSRGGTIPYDHVLAAPDEQRYETLSADYRIAPMDKLNVKVFRSPDLSGDYQVDLTGNIALPLIGSVAAANLTTSQLQGVLAEKLGTKYLEHPDVAVAITESTAHNVTVDGAVKNGGSYPVRSNMTLVQAIALASGTTDDANNRRVAVFRTIGGRRQAAAFDLTAIRRGQAPDPTIYPGDIVVVDGSRIKAIQKQVLSTIPVVSIFSPIL